MNLKKIISLFVFISILTIPKAQILPDNYLENWMSYLADSTLLTQILIPGTHNSGSFNKGSFANIALTQTKGSDISQQLKIGIRAFDFRLEAEDGLLEFYHDTVKQNFNFDNQALTELTTFLSDHPSEAVIIVMRCEGGSLEDYKEQVRNVLEESENEKWIVTCYNARSTLNELRGKILFLFRDDIGTPYLGGVFSGWSDNTTFVKNIKSENSEYKGLVSVEDQYKIDNLKSAVDDKMSSIKENLNNSAQNDDTNHLYITFISGAPTDFSAFINGVTPYTVAKKINRKTAEYINDMEEKPQGIVFMDFADTDDNYDSGNGDVLIQTIISANEEVSSIKSIINDQLEIRKTSDGTIYVNIPDELIFSTKVYDLSGKQVNLQPQIFGSTATLSLYNLIRGIYLLRVETSKGKYVRKMFLP